MEDYAAVATEKNIIVRLLKHRPSHFKEEIWLLEFQDPETDRDVFSTLELWPVRYDPAGLCVKRLCQIARDFFEALDYPAEAYEQIVLLKQRVDPYFVEIALLWGKITDEKELLQQLNIKLKQIIKVIEGE